MLDHLRVHASQVPPKVLVEPPVEIFAEQVCASLAGVEVGCESDCLLCSAEVVNARVQCHVGLEVEARAEVDHDAVDSPLEVVPSELEVSMFVL